MILDPRTSVTAAGPGGFNSNPTAIPGVNALQTMVGYTAWIATGCCVLGMIGLGVWLAFNHESGHQGRTTTRVGYTLGACILVGSASPIAGSFLGFNLFTSTPQAVPGLTGLQSIIGGAAWTAAALCLLGVLIAAAGMLRAHNSGGHFERLGVTLLGCVVVGAASTLTAAFI